MLNLGIGAEVADISSIVLEGITPEGYKAREVFWGDDRIIKSGDVCYRLENPICDSSDNYARLLWVLGKTPFVQRVDVRFGPKDWVHRFPDALADITECRLLASVAQRDPKKRNYLEVFLGSTPYNLSASVEFGEAGGEVVGYKMRFHPSARSLFKLDSRFSAHQYAIWVPPAFEEAMRREEPKFAELNAP